MKLLTITAAALALGACGGRYVPTPCLSEGQVPTRAECESGTLDPEKAKLCEPPMVGKDLTGKADRDFQIIGGSAARLRVWGQGWRNIAEGCRAK